MQPGGAFKMVQRILLAFAVAAVLTGCQTAAEAPATASGKPEVTIKAPSAAIKARLLSLAMDRRFNVTKDTEYLLQIEKPSDNLGAAVLLGSKYDSVPAERIVFTFAPLGDSVRVVAAQRYPRRQQRLRLSALSQRPPLLLKAPRRLVELGLKVKK
jgi:hypothetical protein